MAELFVQVTRVSGKKHISALQVQGGNTLENNMDYYRKGRKYTDKRKEMAAKAVFEKGLRKGCPKCAYGLFALKVSKGLDARAEWENFINVLDDIKRKAENRDADSCFIIGRCYETGCGGSNDIKESIFWYEKAAELGNADSMFNLGCIYCYDESNANYEKGVSYFKKAAKYNLKEAQFNLGHIYESKGENKEALFWYNRARRGGSLEMKEKYMQLKNSLLQERV